MLRATSSGESVIPVGSALSASQPSKRAARRSDAGRFPPIQTGTRSCIGVGAAAIDNLMEDVATAEISRAQVWSWVEAGHFDADRVREEVGRVDAAPAAKEVFEEVALAAEFVEFLTLPAYERL